MSDMVDIQIGHIGMNWKYVVRTIHYLHYVCNIEIPHIRRLVFYS